MGFKAIPSGEAFGRASLTPNDPPRHVDPEHKQCAFYVQLGELVDPREPIPLEIYSGPIQAFIEMECPHGVSAGGAWYNEDYIRELKQISHRLISHFDILDKNKTGPSSGQFEQFEPYYEFQSLTATHWDREIMGKDGLIGSLRELTK